MAESTWAHNHLTLHPPQPAESAWAWSHLTLHPPAPVANIFWHTPTGTYRGRLYTRHNGQTISP